ASAAQLDARDDRIRARAAKYPLCRAEQTAAACQDNIDEFIDGRTRLNDAKHPWDVVVTMPETGAAASVNPPAVTYLDAILAGIHLPYNDIAVELASVLPAPHDGHGDDETGHRWREWVATDDPSKIVLAEGPGSTRTLSASVLQAQSAWPVWIGAAGLIVVLYGLVSIVVRPLYLISLHDVGAAAATDV